MTHGHMAQNERAQATTGFSSFKLSIYQGAILGMHFEPQPDSNPSLRTTSQLAADQLLASSMGICVHCKRNVSWKGPPNSHFESQKNPTPVEHLGESRSHSEPALCCLLEEESTNLCAVSLPFSQTIAFGLTVQGRLTSAESDFSVASPASSRSNMTWFCERLHLLACLLACLLVCLVAGLLANLLVGFLFDCLFVCLFDLLIACVCLFVFGCC